MTARIVATSIKIFLEKGYADTTIDELTATLGIAKRSFYSRFSSKAELFRAAGNAYASAWIDALPPVVPDDRAPAEQLFDVCTDLLRYFLHPDVIAMERTFIAEAVRFPEMVPVLEGIRFRAMHRLHPVLRLIGADTDRELDDSARLIWDLIVGPQMRGAALGLWPCAVTDEITSITRQRINLLLSARSEFLRQISTNQAPPTTIQER